MRLFASRLKIVVEPTGCLGLAGLLGPDAEAAAGRVASGSAS